MPRPCCTFARTELWVLLVAALLGAMPARAEHRAALLVGENAGAAGDEPLHWAEADAKRMRDALVDVGGVAQDDATLLQGATAAELEAALTSLERRLEREGWGEGDSVLVYVSSHAADGELRLAGTRFGIEALRRRVAALHAGVTLLVLDSCDAGAAVRGKGLVALSGDVAVEHPHLSGRVVLASASAGESALETDELEGSLFTHHLVAGLRGAADTSHDGRVTLEEAYDYAQARTVESAAAIRGARQTPVFDVELSGEGALVLSEVARSKGQLVIERAAPGEWTVAPVDGGAATRFTKGDGPVMLALSAGTYRLRVREQSAFSESVVRVPNGGRAIVTADEVSRWPLVPAGRKGPGPELVVIAGGFAGSAAVEGVGTLGGFELGVERLLDASYRAPRFAFGFTASHATGRAVHPAFVEREVELLGEAGAVVAAGPMRLRAMAGLGAVAVHQEGVPGGSRLGLEPRGRLEILVDWPFAPHWLVTGGVGADLSLVRTIDGWQSWPSGCAMAGVGWRG